MSSAMSPFLVPFAIAAVAVLLVLGLVNMLRGGSPNRSQQLMRLRVLLQFVAIIVIMAKIWAMGRYRPRGGAGWQQQQRAGRGNHQEAHGITPHYLRRNPG